MTVPVRWLFGFSLVVVSLLPGRVHLFAKTPAAQTSVA